MSKIINCTPHAIVINDGLNVTTFEPSSYLGRLEMKTLIGNPINGISVSVDEPSTISGLPEQEDGVYLLVSAMLLSAGKLLGRTDLIAPNTNKANRNENGHIVSVPGFVA